jgi:predicted AAA+ superfamily ATPase
MQQLKQAVRRSPVTALLGPRQVGKTTLAHAFAERNNAGEQVTFFDLESLPDQRRLQNPELALGSLVGLVLIDEVQVMPSLFNVLRVLVDRPENPARFLILGSVSPDIIKHVSESLAGRVEFVDLSGLDLVEVGPSKWEQLWIRGGFPLSFLAASDQDSMAWRDGFVRTFLERDIPQLGIPIPPATMRRFWTMLAHYHGQLWNASAIGRSMGLSDKTVRSYLDILTGTFMVRQLQPWTINIKKRQVKSPKFYLRDPGLLHNLLDLPDMHRLQAHPQIGASWEGFVLEQVLQVVRPSQAYFWATHSGAELDLFFIHGGQRFGIEIKFNESPQITRSMHIAAKDLDLHHLWIIYPGQHAYPVDERITVYPLEAVPALADHFQ